MSLAVGDIVTITGPDHQQVTVGIVEICRFNSFKEMLSCLGLGNVLPGIATIVDGVKFYRQFYSREDEQQYDVLALILKVARN